MSQLNSWQKIARVQPNRPFGDGRDGNWTPSSGTQSYTAKSISGTASSGQKVVSLTSSGFTNGDLVLIHQTSGTGANGSWEINRISSGGGTSSLTMQENLYYTYTDNSADYVAQVIRIPQYGNVTINSGITVTGPSYTQDIYGMLIFAARGLVTVTGTLSINGINGSYGNYQTGNPNPAGGMVGGYWGGPSDEANYDGVATSARGGSNLYRGNIYGGGSNAGASGGGGGQYSGAPGGCPGAGGGYGSAGQTVSGVNFTSQGGLAVGSADLTTIHLGGGGGGGCKEPGYYGGGGASGGGAIMIWAKQITVTGSITTNGGNATIFPSGDNAGGGAGSGGAIMIVAGIATLGTTKLVANGGAVGNSQFPGGYGGSGRIALHYASSYTGSTTPTLTATQDLSYIESDAGILMNFI